MNEKTLIKNNPHVVRLCNYRDLFSMRQTLPNGPKKHFKLNNSQI